MVELPERLVLLQMQNGTAQIVYLRGGDFKPIDLVAGPADNRWIPLDHGRVLMVGGMGMSEPLAEMYVFDTRQGHLLEIWSSEKVILDARMHAKGQLITLHPNHEIAVWNLDSGKPEHLRTCESAGQARVILELGLDRRVEAAAPKRPTARPAEVFVRLAGEDARVVAERVGRLKDLFEQRGIAAAFKEMTETEKGQFLREQAKGRSIIDCIREAIRKR
jgi:hypothetical protein